MSNFADKFKETALGEKIILIAGPLMLINGFLPWYDVDLGPFGSVTRNAWESPGALWSILAVLIGLVMAGLVGVTRFSTVQMPALPEGVTWARVQLGLGVAAALFIIIKLINESSYLGFGFYIGILLTAALLVGAGLLFQAERQGGSA